MLQNPTPISHPLILDLLTAFDAPLSLKHYLCCLPNSYFPVSFFSSYITAPSQSLLRVLLHLQLVVPQKLDL